MNQKTKHIVCYSGGHSSSLVAIEVVRKYGKENVILLNHDINPFYEDIDIKRFKKEIANFLNLEITYCNYQDIKDPNKIPSQFEISEKIGSFISTKTRQALCTSRLKTIPFTKYLESNFPDKNVIVYYGFDDSEIHRVERRKIILNDLGYDSDFPLALWGEGKYQKLKDFYKKQNVNFESIEQSEKWKNKDHFTRTIYSTNEINITPPNTYGVYKHANCTGCLKAGQQHWYCVYVNSPEIFNRAKQSEEKIGFSIINGFFLKDLESKFEKMKNAGVIADEHIPFQSFWSKAKKHLKKNEQDEKPCECSF